MEKLIRDADVLVENFAPGAMDRMACLGAHHELNPRLIFAPSRGQRRLAVVGSQGL